MTLIGIISKIIPFITYPLLSKIFSVEDIGQIDIILSSALMATTLVILGQDSSIIRYFNEDNNENSKRALISSILATLLINTIILWGLYLIIDNIFGTFSLLRNIIKNEWLISLILGFAMSSIVDAMLRSQQNIRQYLNYIILYNAISNLPVLWIYYRKKGNIDDYLQLYSACAIFTGLIGLYYARKYIELKKIQIFSIRLMKYGWPLMLVSTVALMQPLIERILIKVMISDFELGLYSVSLKLLMLVQLPSTLLANTILIEIIKYSKMEGGKLTINKIIKFYTYATSVLLITFIVAIDHIVLHLYDSRYIDASIYASMLALGVYINTVGGIYSSGLILAEKTNYKLASALLSTLLSIGISFILVPLMGTIAIPLAFILSKCASTVFELKYSYVYCKTIISKWEDTSEFFIVSLILLSVVIGKYTIRF